MKSIILSLFLFIGFAHADVGLKVGDSVPNLTLLDTKNVKHSLKSEGTRILVFYRGSWCPYCIKQLKNINTYLVPKLEEKDVSLLAISVDKPKTAKKMKRNNNFNFEIISDSNALSLKAFKIVNQLDGNLVKTYKNSYKIDIEGDSGQTHHMIAHPAVFIVKNGKVIFSDVHTDYKQRTDNKEILRALD